jgi:hypothetical protein
MISAGSTTKMARAFMAAEMVMAAANYGTSMASRVRAERVLEDYFALLEQAVPCTEDNPLDRRS